MKRLKQIFGLLILMVIMASFSQCASAYKLQKNAPTTFQEVYFEQWVSGMAEGPAGINIFIELKEDKVQLDSVYFRGKGTKLQRKDDNLNVYVGRFISKPTHKEDIMMSSDSKQEYGNKAPDVPKKFPFELEANECVVSYQLGDKTLYYKISHIKEKESKDHPM